MSATNFKDDVQNALEKNPKHIKIKEKDSIVVVRFYGMSNNLDLRDLPVRPIIVTTADEDAGCVVFRKSEVLDAYKSDAE